MKSPKTPKGRASRAAKPRHETATAVAEERRFVEAFLNKGSGAIKIPQTMSMERVINLLAELATARPGTVVGTVGGEEQNRLLQADSGHPMFTAPETEAILSPLGVALTRIRSLIEQHELFAERFATMLEKQILPMPARPSVSPMQAQGGQANSALVNALDEAGYRLEILLERLHDTLNAVQTI